MMALRQPYFGVNQLLESTRQACLPRPIEGVNQLHLFIGVFQLLGNLLSELPMSGPYLFRLREAEQQFAVILVLLLAQLDFVRQTIGKGVGEGVEFIEDRDDAVLLRE
jgi:hypothetical protein